MPLRRSGRPTRPATLGAAGAFALLALAPAPCDDAPACLGLAGAVAAPCGAAGAAPGRTNCAWVSLAAKSAQMKPQKQGAKASTHPLSVEALGKKGKAFGCPEERAQG